MPPPPYDPILISETFAAVILSWEIIPLLGGPDNITTVLIRGKPEDHQPAEKVT